MLRRIFLRRGSAALVFVWLASAYLLLRGWSEVEDGNLWGSLGAATALVLIAALWTLWIAVIAPWRLSNSRFSRPVYQSQRCLFDADAMIVELEDGSRVSRPYTAVVAVEKTPELILLLQDSGHYLVLPRQAFPDPESLESVLARFSRKTAVAVGKPGASEVMGPGWWTGLKRNLLAGLRLASFLPVRREDFVPSMEQALALALVTTAVGVAAGYVAVGRGAEFSSYSLLDLGTVYLLLLGGAYAVARRENRLSALPLLLVVLLSPNPLFELAISLVDTHGSWESEWLDSAAFLAVFLWLLGVWWRALHLVFAGDRTRTSTALALLVTVAVLPQFWLPQEDYWYPPESQAAEAATDRVNVEDVYYAQTERMNQALERLYPERPGVVDLYHIGFGGYARQKVFRREVGHVREILDSQFDTRNRSLLLINDPTTVGEVPIASRTNLELALQGVAERMNPEEDILFLYLTSHGSPGAELSVWFWPLHLNQLSAGALRRMLDEAGIRWRVVVISACYSGSFVDAFQDDHTLVITAADKDRTSFGCSNENEYTYFGDAYFKHGLEHTRSFVDAFYAARDWVTQREKSEGLTASLPVLHAGKDILAQLHRLEQRLPPPEVEPQEEAEASPAPVSRLKSTRARSPPRSGERPSISSAP